MDCVRSPRRLATYALLFMMTLFSQGASAADCAAPHPGTLGPYGEPFINGMIGDDNQGVDRACDLARVKTNGLRFWVTFYNFTDLDWLRWPNGPVQKLRAEIPKWRALGYRITVTVSLQSTDWNFFNNYSAEPRGPHNVWPSDRRVEYTMGQLVNAFTVDGVQLVDNYQLLNEVGLLSKGGYWPASSDLRDPIHYVNKFYVPMARAIRSLSKAKIFAASTWCGGSGAARTIRNQLIPDLLVAALKDPKLLPDGFDCHPYENDASTILHEVRDFRTAVEVNFAQKVRDQIDPNYQFRLMLSEWNCKAEAGLANAAICLNNIFRNPDPKNPNEDGMKLTDLVDESYYFTFFPYSDPKYSANQLENNLEGAYADGLGNLMDPPTKLNLGLNVSQSSAEVGSIVKITAGVSGKIAHAPKEVYLMNVSTKSVLAKMKSNGATPPAYKVDMRIKTRGLKKMQAVAYDSKGRQVLSRVLKVSVR